MSADDNAPEQAREVEVVVDILLNDVGLALADRSRNLAGAQATLKAIATAERVLAALAPYRAAERQEAAREALDAALLTVAVRRDGHHYDTEPWDKGYRVGVRDAMEDLARQGASLSRANDRADGVTGRSGT